MGVPDDEYQVGALIIAVAVHKGFASFANASANLQLMQDGKRTIWFLVVLWFALTSPVGMIIGMTLSRGLNPVGVALVTVLAAGSVLAVAVTEMLLPAFKDGQGLGRKLLAAWVGMFAMSLIGVWT